MATTEGANMAVDEQEKERELVKRFQQDDKEAWTELFDRYYGPVKNYIYGRIKGMERQSDRDDLSQMITNDALFEAWNRRNQYDEEKSSFSTWLHMRAICRLIDYFRKRERMRNKMEKEHPLLNSYYGVEHYSFGPDERYIEDVPKTRKEKRESFDCSDLDKTTKRLYRRIAAYDGNFNGARFSPRDHKIIALVGRLTPKKEIARKLGMKIRTCDTAIYRILDKIPAKM
jgi:RNA polymerase sigma factor (sigma-70 family)